MESGGARSAERVETPTGVALYPGEAPFPKEWIDRKVNAQRVSRMVEGGHFAALDAPEIWAHEIRTFFYKRG